MEHRYSLASAEDTSYIPRAEVKPKPLKNAAPQRCGANRRAAGRVFADTLALRTQSTAMTSPWQSDSRSFPTTALFAIEATRAPKTCSCARAFGVKQMSEAVDRQAVQDTTRADQQARQRTRTRRHTASSSSAAEPPGSNSSHGWAIASVGALLSLSLRVR